MAGLRYCAAKPCCRGETYRNRARRSLFEPFVRERRIQGGSVIVLKFPSSKPKRSCATAYSRPILVRSTEDRLSPT